MNIKTAVDLQSMHIKSLLHLNIQQVVAAFKEIFLHNPPAPVADFCQA